MAGFDFKKVAQEKCNGCDLITTEENKLTTEEVVAMGTATLDDFATCVIDGKKIGVVTFAEKPEKYHWGGQAITNMVLAFIDAFNGDEIKAREAYAQTNDKDKVVMAFEMTKTKAKMDFLKVTVQ